MGKKFSCVTHITCNFRGRESIILENRNSRWRDLLGLPNKVSTYEYIGDNWCVANTLTVVNKRTANIINAAKIKLIEELSCI